MGQTDILRALWTSARRVACALLAGLMRRYRAEDLEKRIGALPAPEQGAIVLSVLCGLMLVSLLFAQGGIIGMLAFLLLVVLVIN